MIKLLFFPLLGVFSTAYAQVPAPNLMPDGSHDMYIGLGGISHPIYEGAHDTRLSVLPVLQMQWSTGMFLAGRRAGMYLSEGNGYEFGPVLSLEGGRTANKIGALGAAGSNSTSAFANSVGQLIPLPPAAPGVRVNRLLGMATIPTCLTVGGFYNFQLANSLRLTNTALFGAGNDYHGLRWTTDMQYSFNSFSPRHTVSLSAGATFANQSYLQTYFGVSQIESQRSYNRAYSPSAGIKDVHTDVHWNWSWSSAWLLTSSLNLSRLSGSPANSPLVERRTNLSASTALAYRF